MNQRSLGGAPCLFVPYPAGGLYGAKLRGRGRRRGRRRARHGGVMLPNFVLVLVLLLVLDIYSYLFQD